MMKFTIGSVMLEYVHFVPGRLRLKISELRNQRTATEAEAYVATIPAVTSAVANRLTGSLIIKFENDEVTIGDLWRRLCARGYASGPCPEPATTGSTSIQYLHGQRFRRAVLTAVLEAVVQHSAQAFVRALL